MIIDAKTRLYEIVFIIKYIVFVSILCVDLDTTKT